MDAVAVIPARYASTRFPGKPLARDTGRFLIQHVVEQVRRARRIRECIVATDDDRIADAVRGFGGTVAMTSPHHTSGTDRIAEVIAARDLPADAIVLNVQGDEPEISPDHLDRLVARLDQTPDWSAATLACAFPDGADPADPNCVKVVTDRFGKALYFSRSLLPYIRDARGPYTVRPWLLHLGVYAYRRAFLLAYSSWKPSPLELFEKLEQLRVLENGYALGVEVVDAAAPGIDTPEEYARFVARWHARGAP